MSSTTLFMEILDRRSVSDLLFDHATPVTMYRLGRTCWMARRALQDYSRSVFNINRHLRRFFDDPIGFRNLQAQTGTVISGAFAYQFLDRTLCNESCQCLDLHTYPQHAVEVGRWVMTTVGKGYRFKPTGSQHLDFDIAATLDWDSVTKNGSDDDWPYDVCRSSMQNFLRFVANQEESSLTVRIIVAKCSPFKTLIQSYWDFPAFMNAITFSTAYSSYPFATFEERICQHVCSLNAHPQVKEDIHDTRALEELASMSFMFWQRNVDDGLSWVLPFDMRGVSWPKLSAKNKQLSFDPFSLNSWPSHEGFLPDCDMSGRHFQVIEHEIFKFRYCRYGVDNDLERIINRLLKWERVKRSVFPDQKHWALYDDVLFDYKRRYLKRKPRISLASRIFKLRIFGS